MNSWLQITLTVRRADVAMASEVLSATGALSVTLRDASRQPLFEITPGVGPLWDLTRVTGLYQDDTRSAGVLARVREGWGREPFPDFEVSKLKEREWTRAWMSGLSARRFGARLWIRPSWDLQPQQTLTSDARVANVVLDPGLAFGTGSHATTALCLEWLEAAALDGCCVIDYGCGSGILAIAAIKLGARRAFAVDHDPLALQATRDNLARNRVEGRVMAVSPEALSGVGADILIANILAHPLMGLAQAFAELVRPAGQLVLSGVLQGEAQEVILAYREWFEVEPSAPRDDWVRLVGQRKPLNH